MKIFATSSPLALLANANSRVKQHTNGIEVERAGLHALAPGALFRVVYVKSN